MSEIKRPVRDVEGGFVGDTFVFDHFEDATGRHVSIEDLLACVNTQPDAGTEALAAIIRPLVERGIVSHETILQIGKDAILQTRKNGKEQVGDAIADVLDLVVGWCRPQLRIDPPSAGSAPSICPNCNASIAGRALRAVASTTGMVHWVCPDCGNTAATEPLYPQPDAGDVPTYDEDGNMPGTPVDPETLEPLDSQTHYIDTCTCGRRRRCR